MSDEELVKLSAGSPLLMFMHGTFSTAHAGFGELAPDTLAELHRRYGGRVLKTASAAQNATLIQVNFNWQKLCAGVHTSI